MQNTQDIHDVAICDQPSKEQINRIRRIQGQLKSLAQLLKKNEGSCEEYMIRAKTIEKGVSSLINHLVVCHILSIVQTEEQEDSAKMGKDLARLLKLLKK